MKIFWQTTIMCLVLGLAVLLGHGPGLSQEQAKPRIAQDSAPAAKGFLEVRVLRNGAPASARLIVMHLGEARTERRLNVAGTGLDDPRQADPVMTSHPTIKVSIGLKQPHRLTLAPGVYGLAVEDPAQNAATSGVLHLVTIKPGETIKWSGQL